MLSTFGFLPACCLQLLLSSAGTEYSFVDLQFAFELMVGFAHAGGMNPGVADSSTAILDNIAQSTGPQIGLSTSIAVGTQKT